VDPVDLDPDSDQDPQHWFSFIHNLFSKVTNDPASAEPTFKRVKQQSGMRQTWTYHVSFFGEPNRAWVVSLLFL
jgi:hypothetical protein